MTAISWKKAVNGSWTVATNWNPGTVPVSTSTVTIGLSGFYTVSLTGTKAQSVKSLLISDPDATLAIATPSRTDSVATTLNNGGTLAVDATGNGGTTVKVGGKLTNSGDLDIGNSKLTHATNLTAGGLSNTAKGTLNIVGGTAQAALKVNAAAPATWNGSAFLTGNALLQFTGKSGGITKIAGNAEISLDGAQARVALAATPGSNSALTKLGTNAGIWALDDGATVKTTVALANQGTLTVDNGSALSVGGVLNNTGSLGIGDSKLGLATTLTATGFVNTGSLTVAGGSARATLNITGAAPTTVTGSWAVDGDAAVRFASGGITMVAAGGSLSLDGARARVALSAAPGSNSALTKLGTNSGLFSLTDGAAVYTTVGFTNSDITQIDCVGPGGSIFDIGGTLTNGGAGAGGGIFVIGNTATTAATNVTAKALVNNGSIDLAGGKGQTELAVAAAAPGALIGDFGLTGNALLQFGGGAITTIGSNGSLSLDGAQARVAVSGTPGSNSALTTLGSNLGSFSLADGAAVSTTVGFTNSDLTEIDNSGTGGSSFAIGGTLTNRSEVLIGNTAATAATNVTATGLVNDDVINLTGGKGQAELAIAAAAPATLTGSFDLTGNALLQFASGAITTIDGNLSLDGAQARVAVSGTPGSNSALTTLGSNTGTFALADGASVTTTGGFSNSGTTEVDNFGTGGSGFAIGGTLTNNGAVEIGNTATTAATTVTATGLVNHGSIDLTGGTGQAELAVAAAAPATLTGSFDLTGNALLQFGSGAITTIDGSLYLDGAQARVAVSGTPGSNSALTTLGSNLGSFSLADGASVTTTGGFSNSGTTEVDNSGTGGSSLTIGGLLNNSGGDFVIGNTAMVIATTVTATGLINTGGVVNITGGTAGGTTQAELSIGAAAPGTLTGTVDLTGNALLLYTTGSITAIANGADLTLDGAQAEVAVTTYPGSNTALTSALLPLGSNFGTFQLADGASVGTKAGVGFNNRGTTNIDSFGTGGSTFAIGGTLTNSGDVYIGNAAMLAATTVTATGLINGGVIALTGGTAGQAELAISGAAPATLTGEVDLTGNAVLQFSSGAITGIASGAGLFLDGAQAHVALSGTPGNSALTALGSNAGTFSLADGGSVSTTGGFSNSGLLEVDSFGTGGSSLAIGGTLTNGGDVIIGNGGMVGATTVTAAGLVNTSAGSIHLTGDPTGQAELLVAGAAPATLNGTVDLTGNALLQFGSGAITAIGSGAHLSLDGAQALVAISGTPGNSALSTLGSNAGTFALADGAAVSTTGGFSNRGTTEIDNSGTGGSSLAIGGTLNNRGSVFIGNGGMVAAATVTAASLVNTGLIDLIGGTGQAELLVAGAAPGTLTGTVELSGNALLQFGSGAITAIASSSSLSLDGAQAFVALSGTPGSNSALSTLGSNAGTFKLADGAAVSTTGGFSNSGTTDIDNSGVGGSSFAVGGSLNNSGILSVDRGTKGGSSVTIGGTLTNSGDVLIGNSHMLVATTVTAAALVNTNTGVIDLTGGVAQAELAVAGAAPGTLTGTVDLTGNALLQFGSGSITAIGTLGSLTLDGAQALVALSGTPGNSALTALGSNAGLFSLADGAAVSTTVGFNNSGTTDIDRSGSGNSTFAIGGMLTNSGGVYIGNSGMLGATTVTATGLINTNTGFIDLVGGAGPAELLVAGAAPGTLTGTVDLTGNALLQFTSGSITAIGSGSILSLNGAQALVGLSGTPGRNSALTTLASNAGEFLLANGAALTTTGPFSNSGITEVDDFGAGGSTFGVGGTLTNSGDVFIGHSSLTAATTVTAAGIVNTNFMEVTDASVSTPGTFSNSGTTEIDNSGPGGSSLSIGGTLTNSGNVTIGNSSLTAATNVTATTLVNTGAIDLTGGAAQAELAIAGPAAASLVGTYDLTGNALLQFASGAIGAISSTGDLSLNGAQARVAVSGTPGSNSALTALASNAGVFNLTDGASVSTTGGFSNSGSTEIDRFGVGGSNLTIGGPLTNSGSFYIGNYSQTTATNVQATALTNSAGFVEINGNSGGGSAGTLTLAGASSDTSTIFLDRGGVLALDNTLTVNGNLDFFGGTLSGGTAGTLAGAGPIFVFTSGTLQNETVANGTTVIVDPGATLVENGVTVVGTGALSGSNSTLTFVQNGTDPMTNTSGFATINLANGGANSLTLTGSNFTGVTGNVITVNDGNSGNTVNGSALASPDAIIVHAGTGADSLTGGTGNDVFFAGGDTTMTGGTGTNQFTFADIGSNTIQDFGASGTNELAFSDAGFNLGLGGASSTPTPLPGALIGSLTAGTFSNTTQRFAYNSSTGTLEFSADGSGSTPGTIATLSSHPTVVAGQLFYVT